MVDIQVLQIKQADGEGKLKAMADVQIGAALIIKSCLVYDGRSGLFVAMPRKMGKDGRWFDVISPGDNDFRKSLQDKVLEAYDREVAKDGLPATSVAGIPVKRVTSVK